MFGETRLIINQNQKLKKFITTNWPQFFPVPNSVESSQDFFAIWQYLCSNSLFTNFTVKSLYYKLSTKSKLLTQKFAGSKLFKNYKQLVVAETVDWSKLKFTSQTVAILPFVRIEFGAL